MASSFVEMSELPQCVYKRDDHFFAQIKIRGDTFRAPLRNTVEAVKEDLLGLQKKHRSPKTRLLPRFVNRYSGVQKGYFAKRQMKDGTNHAIQCKAPLRTSIFLASLDAKKLAEAPQIATGLRFNLVT